MTSEPLALRPPGCRRPTRSDSRTCSHARALAGTWSCRHPVSQLRRPKCRERGATLRGLTAKPQLGRDLNPGRPEPGSGVLAPKASASRTRPSSLASRLCQIVPSAVRQRPTWVMGTCRGRTPPAAGLRAPLEGRPGWPVHPACASPAGDTCSTCTHVQTPASQIAPSFIGDIAARPRSRPDLSPARPSPGVLLPGPGC